MTRWRHCKRSEFVRRLRALGFDGAYSGTRHEFMVFEQHRLTIPSNPEYSVAQLRFMLREVSAVLGREISAGDWADLA